MGLPDAKKLLYTSSKLKLEELALVARSRNDEHGKHVRPCVDVDVSILAHQKKSPKDVADLAAIVAHQNLDIDLHVEPSERQHAKRASVERRAKQEQKSLKSYAAKMKLIELRHKDSLTEEEAKHMEQLEKEVKGVDTSTKGTSPAPVRGRALPGSGGGRI
jgi:hypothetical protein